MDCLTSNMDCVVFKYGLLDFKNRLFDFKHGLLDFKLGLFDHKHGLLFFQSNCCRGEIANQKVGGCTLHSQKCGAGVGLFLNPNRCELLILFQRHKGK